MTTSSPIYTQSRWSLADLFPPETARQSISRWQNWKQKVAEFEKVRDRLQEDISHEEFMAIIRQEEDINYQGHMLYSFASLRFSEDTQNQQAQTLMARIDQYMADLSNRTIFFSLWWKSLPDETAQRLMENTGDVRYWLEEMRRFKPHTLSEPEEKSSISRTLPDRTPCKLCMTPSRIGTCLSSKWMVLFVK
jgi:oligoendopeptidase F